MPGSTLITGSLKLRLRLCERDDFSRFDLRSPLLPPLLPVLVPLLLSRLSGAA